MKRESKPKLIGRDFVSIGIYSILIFILFIVVSLPFMPFMAVTYPFIGAVCAFFTAPVFMLMTYKVAKRGTILLSAVVMTLIYTIMGYVYLLPFGVVTGAICEAIMWKQGSYRKFWRTAAAFSAFSVLMYVGSTYIPIYILGSDYYLRVQSQNTDAAMLHIQFAMSPLWASVAVAVTVAMAIAGCVFGRRILKRHFIKAGLILER